MLMRVLMAVAAGVACGVRRFFTAAAVLVFGVAVVAAAVAVMMVMFVVLMVLMSMHNAPRQLTIIIVADSTPWSQLQSQGESHRRVVN